MDPTSIKRWSRRIIIAIVLILGLIGVSVVLADMGVFSGAAEVIDSALEALEKFSETF